MTKTNAKPKKARFHSRLVVGQRAFLVSCQVTRCWDGGRAVGPQDYVVIASDAIAAGLTVEGQLMGCRGVALVKITGVMRMSESDVLMGLAR